MFTFKFQIVKPNGTDEVCRTITDVDPGRYINYVDSFLAEVRAMYVPGRDGDYRSIKDKMFSKEGD